MSARHRMLDLVPLHDDAAQIAVEPVVLGLRDRSGVGKHGQHESAGIVLVVEMLRVAVRIRPEPEFFVKAKPPRSRFVDYGLDFEDDRLVGRSAQMFHDPTAVPSAPKRRIDAQVLDIYVRVELPVTDQSDEFPFVGISEQTVKFRSQSRSLVLERSSLDPWKAVVIQFPNLGEQGVLGRLDSYGFHEGKDSQMNGTDKRYAVSGMSPIILYLYIVACGRGQSGSLRREVSKKQRGGGRKKAVCRLSLVGRIEFSILFVGRSEFKS